MLAGEEGVPQRYLGPEGKWVGWGLLGTATHPRVLCAKLPLSFHSSAPRTGRSESCNSSSPLCWSGLIAGYVLLQASWRGLVVMGPWKEALG